MNIAHPSDLNLSFPQMSKSHYYEADICGATISNENSTAPSAKAHCCGSVKMIQLDLPLLAHPQHQHTPSLANQSNVGKQSQSCHHCCISSAPAIFPHSVQAKKIVLCFIYHHHPLACLRVSPLVANCSCLPALPPFLRPCLAANRDIDTEQDILNYDLIPGKHIGVHIFNNGLI